MIEQQIRTWEVLDQSVLDTLLAVPREQFVAPAYANLAFADMELPLCFNEEKTGEVMLAPKVEARVLQALALRPEDSVLEIGSGSGYMAALLGAHARQVLSVEIHSGLAQLAKHNLVRSGCTNVTVTVGDGLQGGDTNTQFDAIVISGGLPFVPANVLNQLKITGRLMAFVGEFPAMNAQLITRTGEQAFNTVTLFETQVQPLHHALHLSAFQF
jgi:protein-L-isoaspartate(D-aspartate) O-methyltransferase